ncbi:hypothetical protein J6590_014698 [Homalodisca vitripennis]|nr:hypothetical protein J6590_014698 [Homalodisca vitripennis]
MQVSDTVTTRTTYYALFESHLRYCLGTTAGNLRKILPLQKRAVRIMSNLGNYWLVYQRSHRPRRQRITTTRPRHSLASHDIPSPVCDINYINYWLVYQRSHRPRRQRITTTRPRHSLAKKSSTTQTENNYYEATTFAHTIPAKKSSTTQTENNYYEVMTFAHTIPAMHQTSTFYYTILHSLRRNLLTGRKLFNLIPEEKD